MAVDVTEVSKLDVEPGTLPETMAAWVIRQEREGEPKDAFQIEEIEVPEPGAFEVIVRVMAAGVNFNNVWAALGKPVSVFGYGDHPEYGHHIGGSDASGIVWKVGEGVTRWKPGDEVVIHCNQASYEDVEVHGLDPMAAPSQEIWGYETTWGSFAQFTKVQAQQLLPKPRNLSWVESSAYGLTYFTAYRMLIDRCNIQAGHNVLIWGAAGGLGVFATQLCKAAGANAVGVVSSDEKGELVKQLGAVDYVNRNEFGEMMRTDANHPAVDPAAEKERFKASRGFAKRVKEILGDAPDIVFEHVGQATFPTSVFTVKPFGKVVICGATSGYNARLRRPLPVDEAEGDPRLALRQRVRVHARQPADGRGQDPPGALAGDGVRRRPRGAPDAPREPPLGQDLDPRRRHRRRRGQARGRRGRDLGRGRRLARTLGVATREPGGPLHRMAHRALPARPFLTIWTPRSIAPSPTGQRRVHHPQRGRHPAHPPGDGVGEPSRPRALVVLRRALGAAPGGAVVLPQADRRPLARAGRRRGAAELQRTLLTPSP